MTAIARIDPAEWLIVCNGCGKRHLAHGMTLRGARTALSEHSDWRPARQPGQGMSSADWKPDLCGACTSRRLTQHKDVP